MPGREQKWDSCAGNVSSHSPESPLRCRLASYLSTLVVEYDVEQRAVDLQSTFGTASVVNEAQLSESVHKEAEARTSRPDHLGQRFLADLRDVMTIADEVDAQLTQTMDSYMNAMRQAAAA
jgi:hypothetical protein